MKRFSFLQNLDADLKQSLMIQLRNLWTHTSTALEGNTLSLGETAFVIEEGLTVSGKPLKDHEEVVGHAQAIELIYSYLDRHGGITKEELFELHKAIQTERISDIYKPVGNWKVEPNGTTAITDDQQQIFLEYAAPNNVPALMQAWFDLLDRYCKADLDKDKALNAYAELHISFVRIHPFFDGNGRIARLVANLPVLKTGLPPIIIPTEKRREYIRLLSKYELAVGQPVAGEALLPQKERLEDFIKFCGSSWKPSLEIVEAIADKQAMRNQFRPGV
ncbi:Filamentation induced by cAMP protein Fic [Candidatus Thiomargarita nelsonii]|uniref:Filamentation induced by cAMP protein Fic n=1 Tax=Candidatus Thiomargarita nelsonii TaxID=1003181 RepID=A0A176RTZ0_9GAMM|nr:Filamentation induced by cAMP protein Fic [Candidatus Thiomargarita nelsonii]